MPSGPQRAALTITEGLYGGVRASQLEGVAALVPPESKPVGAPHAQTGA
jgi:hypothetical protein